MGTWFVLMLCAAKEMCFTLGCSEVKNSNAGLYIVQCSAAQYSTAQCGVLAVGACVTMLWEVWMEGAHG